MPNLRIRIEKVDYVEVVVAVPDEQPGDPGATEAYEFQDMDADALFESLEFDPYVEWDREGRSYSQYKVEEEDTDDTATHSLTFNAKGDPVVTRI